MCSDQSGFLTFPPPDVEDGDEEEDSEDGYYYKIVVEGSGVGVKGGSGRGFSG